MASVSPTLPPLAGLAGNPRTFVRGGAVASTDTLGTAGVILNFQGLTLSIYFFSAVSDTDTWDASSTIAPPKRALACAWQGDDVDDDLATAYVTSIGGIGSDGAIQFQTSGAGKTGWLWVLHQE